MKDWLEKINVTFNVVQECLTTSFAMPIVSGDSAVLLHCLKDGIVNSKAFDNLNLKFDNELKIMYLTNQPGLVTLPRNIGPYFRLAENNKKLYKAQSTDLFDVSISVVKCTSQSYDKKVCDINVDSIQFNILTKQKLKQLLVDDLEDIKEMNPGSDAEMQVSGKLKAISLMPSSTDNFSFIGLNRQLELSIFEKIENNVVTRLSVRIPHTIQATIQMGQKMDYWILSQWPTNIYSEFF